MQTCQKQTLPHYNVFRTPLRWQLRRLVSFVVWHFADYFRPSKSFCGNSCYPVINWIGESHLYYLCKCHYFGYKLLCFLDLSFQRRRERRRWNIAVYEIDLSVIDVALLWPGSFDVFTPGWGWDRFPPEFRFDTGWYNRFFCRQQ